MGPGETALLLGRVVILIVYFGYLLVFRVNSPYPSFLGSRLFWAIMLLVPYFIISYFVDVPDEMILLPLAVVLLLSMELTRRKLEAADQSSSDR
jgi:predicted membrane protein